MICSPSSFPIIPRRLLRLADGNRGRGYNCMTNNDTPKDTPTTAPQFAGSAANVPIAAADDPAFYERAPLLRAFADALHTGLRRHAALYLKEGLFHVAEVGTYRGRGLRALLETASVCDIRIHVTALDSFGGFPEFSQRDLEAAPPNAAWLRRRVFADTTAREVEAYVGEAYVGSFNLVEGFFADTLPKLPEQNYLFVVIDCDLYSSHVDVMPYFYNRLLPGGVMFFDDYNSVHYPMAKIAIDEFIADKPEKLYSLGYGPAADNSVKAYLVKSGTAR